MTRKSALAYAYHATRERRIFEPKARVPVPRRLARFRLSPGGAHATARRAPRQMPVVLPRTRAQTDQPFRARIRLVTDADNASSSVRIVTFWNAIWRLRSATDTDRNAVGRKA